MVGTSQLVCAGFIESETFRRSKDDLKQELGLTDRQIDDRLEALVWTLNRNAAAAAAQVPGRNLWVAITPRGLPSLRVYLRPRSDVQDECEWMWIEQRP